MVAVLTALSYPASALATPACPPGTGSPPHLGWHFLVPFLAGALTGIALMVAGIRRRPKSAGMILGGIAVGAAGFTMGVVLFFMGFWRCVPR
jgi:hypothetical protein